MTEMLQFEFMRNALMAGLLISLACGVVGTLVVVNKLSFLAGGVAHAAYGGLGVAVFFKLPIAVGTLTFSVLSSCLMGYVSTSNRQRSDTIIGAMWAAGMAVGIVLVDMTPGYYADMMSYLFGSIMAVPQSSLFFMAILDGCIVLVVALLYKELLAFSYDEEFAAISGVPVTFLRYLLLIMIAVTVVMLIKAVGLILVIALFTIPASLAEMFTKDLKRIMAVASAASLFFTTAGLLLSYFFDVTAGAMIILTACVGYGVLYAVKGLRMSR